MKHFRYACALVCALFAAGQAAGNFEHRVPTVLAGEDPPSLLIPYIPRTGQAAQGFFGFDNFGGSQAEVTLWLYDAQGTEVALVAVSVPAGTIRWLSSDDLLNGNADKGTIVTPRAPPGSSTL